MGKIDKGKGVNQGLSRRDFLKTGAVAAAAAAAGAEIAARPSTAAAATVAETYHTTCPYCSASCGQFIDVAASGNVETEVLDIYGDHMSPMNDGGLCAKGAGTFQLVNNQRRLGAFTGSHPVNDVFEYDGSFADGIAYKRTGNGEWNKMHLQTAMTEIAGKLKDARGDVTYENGYNSKGVAFFGSSHMNNEQNYTYRRLIAQFGTSNVEHQARI